MEYNISWEGRAQGQFNDLLARATTAGKRAEFEYWYDEFRGGLRHPPRAAEVGRPLRLTNLPGGFERHWFCGCFHLQYVIFPDRGIVLIYHIEFTSPDWA